MACRPAAGSWWPYPASPDTDVAPRPETADIDLPAMPYYAWGNRADGAMRVWLARA